VFFFSVGHLPQISGFRLACVATVFIGCFFAFWSRENWGERKKNGMRRGGGGMVCARAKSEPFFALAPIFARPKSEKFLERGEKPYGNACYAGYFSLGQTNGRANFRLWS